MRQAFRAAHFNGTALRLCTAALLLLVALVVSLPNTAAIEAQAATSPIQHVVLIFQENHSFDEVLGDFCEVTERCNGYTGDVTLSDGSVVPLHQATDFVPHLAHTVIAQSIAMDGGKMDGWDQIAGCHEKDGYACLSYYTPSMIPNLAALAGEFAVSDATFSSYVSPSFGGHVSVVAGTLDNFTGDIPVVDPFVKNRKTGGWGCDSYRIVNWRNPATQKVSKVPSCVPDYSLSQQLFPDGGAFEPTPVEHVPTLMDSMQNAGVSWRIYSDQYGQTGYEWSICPTFADCLDTSEQANMTETANILTDAGAGTLPSVSLVLPNGPQGNTSQHNGTSMATGDTWIGQVVTALENGPEWGSTAVFITYDDCGCFYDHVTPPQNPDGTSNGVRVPMVIVSPYARPDYTDSTDATFASIMAYIEHLFNLAPLSTSDAGAYDYSNAFNYNQTPLKGLGKVLPIKPPPGEVLSPDPDDPT